MEDSKEVMECEVGVCTPTTDQNTTEEATKQKESKNKLIYFGDPMCSWCWGIAGHLQKLKEEFSGELDFQVVLGGLRPGGGDLWNDEMKGFLREHWEHVETASGQPFNYNLLERDEFNYDTEPPSRAVRVIRDLAADKEFEFFKAIQGSFYAENNNPERL